MNVPFLSRETEDLPSNPIGLDGIEYIEFATARPQALGQVLETIGFRPVARHRSREVLLYRQGGMNVIVNASTSARMGTDPDQPPRISAIALRVRDARAAFERAVDRGAWPVAHHAEVMELNIPGIHGPGGSHIYFIDRYKEFSIYDVDFTLIPTVDPHPPAMAGMRFFGVVQYVGLERTQDWLEFYQELFDFTRLADEERFGILPKGTLMRSPCGQFYLQLIEPASVEVAAHEQEMYQRVGFGTPNVLEAVARLRQNGVEFLETPATHTEVRGALTRPVLGSVMFELVKDPAPAS